MKVVCLSTPVEDPARHAAALAHHTAAGLTASNGFDVRFAHGLHKSHSGLVTTHPYMVDRPDPGAEPFYIGPHPVNIWIGHYMIWNALLVSDDWEWFVVECDAKFLPGWEKVFWRAYTGGTMLDYDLIYMGSCCTTGRQALQVGTGRPLHILAGTAPQCNHAYMLTKAAAEIMVRTLRKVWAPVDIQQASECWGDRLARCVEPVAPPSRPLRVYTVLPRIVEQFDTEIPE